MPSDEPYGQADHDRAVEQGGIVLLVATIALIVAAIVATCSLF